MPRWLGITGGERAPALTTLALLGATLAVAWLPYVPPRAGADASAPATAFSVERARAHLERIAGRPRPLGSAAHRDVQQYLVAELRRLGVEPAVQTTSVASDRPGWISVAATVSNVAARVPGTGDGSAVLLVTHYDGVNGGPGASDAGAAVAALLEAVRALRAGPRLRNDVIVLFTDAEEPGLLGARAFAAAHPWAKDVRLVLNFDARGTHGPALMFETSPGNAWLVQALTEGATAPVASSLFYELYTRLPNNTDFSVFRRAGWPGMNFAYIGGVTAYHTRLDDVASVDLRSLQHHGLYAVSLARYFGNADLRAHSPGNSVFFNLPLVGLADYGERWSAPLALALAVLLAVAVGRGVRSRRLRLRTIALSVAGFVGLVIAIAVLIGAAWWGITAVKAEYRWMPLGETYDGGVYVWAFVLAAVALTAVAFQRLRRRGTLLELYAGVLIIWGALALFFGFVVPGGSYLWTWPALFATGGFAYLLQARREQEPSAAELRTATLGAIPGVVLLAPIIWLVYQGMTVRMSSLLMALVALLLGLLLPFLELMRRAWGARWPIVPALAATALTLVAGLSFAFDARQPRPDSLFYVSDVDQARAWWASSDRRTDQWTAEYLGHSPTRAPLAEQFPAFRVPFLRAPAPPVASLQPPHVELISAAPRGDGRLVRLRVRSRRAAEELWVNVAPGTEILEASVNGARLNTRRTAADPWSLRYVGLPPEGIDLTLHVRGGTAVGIQAVDRTSGLPDLPVVARNPRPPNTMPAPIFDSFQDATFVGTRLVVPPGGLAAASVDARRLASP